MDGWCWVSRRSGWLLELMTELTKRSAFRDLSPNRPFQELNNKSPPAYCYIIILTQLNSILLKVLDTFLLLPLFGTFDPKVDDISSN